MVEGVPDSAVRPGLLELEELELELELVEPVLEPAAQLAAVEGVVSLEELELDLV